MAKPKAPRWLTEAFRDGVDERDGNFQARRGRPPAYPGASGLCWLAQNDPVRRPCSGPLERFHFIPRQRVENALWEALRASTVRKPIEERGWPDTFADFSPRSTGGGFYAVPLTREEIWDLILLAAWDPRNGGLGCEHHHRRFDGHACSPRAPKIIVPMEFLPYHLIEFVFDYGLQGPYDERFSS